MRGAAMCGVALAGVLALGVSTAGAAPRWTIVPGSTGHREAKLVSVTSVSPGDAWAVGERDDGPLAEHWDGTAWRFVQVPEVGATENELQGVGAIASNDVW